MGKRSDIIEDSKWINSRYIIEQFCRRVMTKGPIPDMICEMNTKISNNYILLLLKSTTA